MNIETKYESERGCGYRKPGGYYLVGGTFGAHCGKLPIELNICPCCGGGIKFSRGFTWISHDLVAKAPCSSEACKKCPVWYGQIEYYGLMWVGEKFYKTPDDFLEEGAKMGISKRISNVPKEFEIGKDWVLLAHRKAVPSTVVTPNGMETEYRPGIFQAFMPTAIEYVVKGDETEEELGRLVKRGVTPVKVTKVQTQTTFLD